MERYKIKDRGQLKEFRQILLPSLGLTRNRSNDLQKDFFRDCSRRQMAAPEAEEVFFILSGDFQFQVLASRWRDAIIHSRRTLEALFLTSKTSYAVIVVDVIGQREKEKSWLHQIWQKFENIMTEKEGNGLWLGWFKKQIFHFSPDLPISDSMFTSLLTVFEYDFLMNMILKRFFCSLQ